MNSRFFRKNVPTDVIAFQLDDSEDVLEGEVYISLDRALTQAREYNQSLQDEIERLAIHGLLHLGGMNDAMPRQKKALTKKEDFYLKSIK